MINCGAIIGWIAAISSIVSGGLYLGNLNGKLTSLESELRNTTQRVDGVYIFIAQQGGNVKQAIQASDLDRVIKKRLINSLKSSYVPNQQDSESNNVK